MHNDHFQSKRNYDDTWDLSGITLIHKLYRGLRRYPSGPKRGQCDIIHEWGPYSFKCDYCNYKSQQYETIKEHQKKCKKLNINSKSST